MWGSTKGKVESIRNEFLKQPGILSFTRGFPPTLSDRGHPYGTFSWEGKKPEETLTFDWIPAYYDYLETYKIELIQGRFFSRDFPEDKSNYIVNETAVKAMGLKDPIGKNFTFSGKEGKIIGVVKDFHVSSLRVKINPVLFIYSEAFSINIKVNPDNLPQTMSYIENKWKEFNPERQFEYNFVSESINNFYRNERKTGIIIKYFTFLALLVFSLGIFGLISFIAEQRTKEIGIRKVLGATIPGIVKLIFSEFTILLVISNFIAWPIGYIIMNKWLENFAYRINMNLTIFIMTGMTTLVLSFLTVGYQTIKAARMNPVDSLRYE